MKKEKSCGAIIINDKNQVLLIKHNQGHISFPKGHMEEGETEEITAYREVLEETGLEVEIIPSFRVVTTYCIDDDIIKDVVYFKANVIGGTLKPQLEEIAEVGFVDIDKAFEILTYEQNKETLKQFIGSDENEY